MRSVWDRALDKLILKEAVLLVKIKHSLLACVGDVNKDEDKVLGYEITHCEGRILAIIVKGNCIHFQV